MCSLAICTKTKKIYRKFKQPSQNLIDRYYVCFAFLDWKRLVRKFRFDIIFTYFDLISVENKNHCEFAQLRDMLIK